jgi:uncharacterized protein
MTMCIKYYWVQTRANSLLFRHLTLQGKSEMLSESVEVAMSVVQIRFYAELNDFLSPTQRGKSFPHRIEGRVSIKDMIESLGVPHTEIDLILVHGVSVDFSYLVGAGDHVSVYPVFEAFDISPVLRLRPRPLRQSRFVLDVHLGKLARYLRLMGFDSLYRNDYSDDELASLSQRESRILLTRDRGLLKRNIVTHGHCVRETRPTKQLQEILRRFDLFNSIRPFERCLQCNVLLEAIDKDSIQDRLPPSTREHFAEFRTCVACHRIYWRGSHHQRMQEFIQDVVEGHRR